MDAATNTCSGKDELVTAIGVLALLIGAATGNAIAMLTIAIVSFAVISIIYRRKIGAKAMLAIVAAASIAFVVAMAITNL